MSKNILPKVEELLELRQMTMAELAQRVDLEVSDIEKLKSFNHKQMGQVAIVQALALALGINLYYFLGDDVIGPRQILSRVNVFDRQKLLNGDLAPFIRVPGGKDVKHISDEELDGLIQMILHMPEEE